MVEVDVLELSDEELASAQHVQVRAQRAALKWIVGGVLVLALPVMVWASSQAIAPSDGWSFMPAALMIIAFVLMVIAVVGLAFYFRAQLRRMDVVAEMERRGLHGLVVVGIPDHMDRVLARRMLVPGVGFVLSMLLLVAWVSVLLFTPLGDVSWAVSLSGVPLAAIFVCIVWLAVVQRSAQKQDGAR